MKTYRSTIVDAVLVIFVFMIGTALFISSTRLPTSTRTVYAHTIPTPASAPDALLTTAGVILGSPQPAQSAYAGTTITYTIAITNTGTNTDSYTVTVTGDTWTTTLARSSVDTLAAGSSGTITATVAIPADAAVGAKDSFTVTLTSLEDNTVTSKLTLTSTSQGKQYDVALTPMNPTLSSMPGSTVTYAITITNQGQETDTYTIALLGATWATTSSIKTTNALEAGGKGAFTVEVTIPSTAYGGSTDIVTVQVTSTNDANAHTESRLTTRAKVAHNMALYSAYTKLSGKPGAVITYTIFVTNTGNITESFAVVMEPGTWNTQLALSPYPGDVYDSQTNFTLSPVHSATLQVFVTIPANAERNSKDYTTLTVTGIEEPLLTRTLNIETTAGATYALELGVATPSKMGLPNSVVTYTLSLTNTSNITDTYYVAFNGNTWDATLDPSDGLGTVEAGATTTFTVSVRVPRVTAALAATYGDSDTLTVRIVSNGNQDIFRTVTVTTTIQKPASIPLEDELDKPEVVALDTNSVSGMVGTEATYRLTIYNKSLDDETVVVGGYGNTWQTSLRYDATLSATEPVEPVEVIVPTGERKSVSILVSIPATAEMGATDTFTVTVGIKGSDTGKQAVHPITTTAQRELQAKQLVYLPIVVKE